MPVRTEADVLQSLVEELEGLLPERWSRVEMIIDFDPQGSINFQNTYADETGRIAHVPFSPEFLELVPELAEAVATDRSGYFRRATFTLDASGDYRTQYSYDGDGLPDLHA